MKADSELAKGIAAGRPGPAADLGKFPADAAVYAYMNLNAASFSRIQGIAMSMLGPAGKKSPEMEKATAQPQGARTHRVAGSMTMGEG